MNERIKELAQQAGINFEIIAWIVDDKMSEKEDVWMDSPENLEKFAELIVRECTNHITNQQDLVETNWQCKDGIHIVYSLKEHFGVEEC